MKRNVATFTVSGPFPVPYEKRPGGRVFSSDALEEFWDHADTRDLKNKKGVYVFAIKPPRTTNYTPCYVGQTTRTFCKEVFTDHKINKYHGALARYGKGAPYLFLIVHPSHNLNARQITAIENFLILSGKSVNDNIENERGIFKPDWAIRGVINGETRGASNSAKMIRKMFKIYRPAFYAGRSRKIHPCREKGQPTAARLD